MLCSLPPKPYPFFNFTKQGDAFYHSLISQTLIPPLLKENPYRFFLPDFFSSALSFANAELVSEALLTSK